jgi:hypothetical protein
MTGRTGQVEVTTQSGSSRSPRFSNGQETKTMICGIIVLVAAVIVCWWIAAPPRR